MTETTRDGARRGRAGRPVSMADVAREAGVSQQTVSRVVNEQPNVSDATRAKVVDAIARLGFRPNYAGKTLREGRYKTVGLCTFDLSMAGNSATVEGIVVAAREQGYAVTMIEMGPELSPYSVVCASRRLSGLPVDGAIINLTVLPEDFEAYTPLPGLTTVLMSMYVHPRCTTVESDQYGCGLLVMGHLRELGHREIRFVGGPSFHSHSAFREAAWRDELERAGIVPVEPLRGDWSADSGYEAGVRLAEDARMTAVFVANDQMALGVIEALRDRGRRVPQNVSVVGVDDSLRGVVPHNELTTVRFDNLERGRVLFARAVEPGPVEAIRIPGKLIERASAARRR